MFTVELIIYYRKCMGNYQLHFAKDDESLNSISAKLINRAESAVNRESHLITNQIKELKSVVHQENQQLKFSHLFSIMKKAP